VATRVLRPRLAVLLAAFFNYATNLDGRSQSHTGTQVRIAAQGPQAANVAGVTDQTDLFHTMARVLGLSG
jgi:alkaline phosphatase